MHQATPEIDAAVAEAVFWLRHQLAVLRWPWQWRRRAMAIRKYLTDVLKAHLYAMLAEAWLPDQEQSEQRLAAAIEHAVAAAEDPRVAAVAKQIDRQLADIWRVGWTAERARRWHANWGINPIHTTPEWEAYEARARAELDARRQAPSELEVAADEQPAEVNGTTERPGGGQDREALEALIAYRAKLLAEYKAATGASEYAIYNAKGPHGHTCRKAEFLAWKRGELPPDSSMALSLERFLREKRPPK